MNWFAKNIFPLNEVFWSLAQLGSAPLTAWEKADCIRHTGHKTGQNMRLGWANPFPASKGTKQRGEERGQEC